jgi:hypothetical protein
MKYFLLALVYLFCFNLPSNSMSHSEIKLPLTVMPGHLDNLEDIAKDRPVKKDLIIKPSLLPVCISNAEILYETSKKFSGQSSIVKDLVFKISKKSLRESGSLLCDDIPSNFKNNPA